MGHYASEMSSTWGKNIDERQALRERGYNKHEYGLAHGTYYTCNDCGTVCKDPDKHDRVCILKGENDATD